MTPPTNHVTYVDFIQNISWLTKGSHDQRSRLFHHLIPPPLTLEKIKALLVKFLKVLFTSNSAHFHSVHDWPINDESLMGVVTHIMESLAANSTSNVIDKVEIQIWLANSPSANTIIQMLMTLIFVCPHVIVQQMFSDNELMVPQKIIHPLLKVDFTSQLLDQSYVMFLHSYLSFDLKGVAYPLFSSQVHGQSFSTFCRQIIDRGPTIIVIRDKDGYLFGGMAGSGWKFTPQFLGKYYYY